MGSHHIDFYSEINTYFANGMEMTEILGMYGNNSSGQQWDFSTNSYTFEYGGFTSFERSDDQMIYNYFIDQSTNNLTASLTQGSNDGEPSCVGCTDPMACNYDDEATLDDGSCEMPDVCGDCGTVYTVSFGDDINLIMGSDAVTIVEFTVDGSYIPDMSGDSWISNPIGKKVRSITYYTASGLSQTHTRPSDFNYNDANTLYAPAVYPESWNRTNTRNTWPQWSLWTYTDLSLIHI